MKLSTYPHLSHCLALLGTDMGAILNEGAEIPEKWQERVVQAEFELSQLTLTQVETFTMGEESEQGWRGRQPQMQFFTTLLMVTSVMCFMSRLIMATIITR
jgi:hypothetical protein